MTLNERIEEIKKDSFGELSPREGKFRDRRELRERLLALLPYTNKDPDMTTEDWKDQLRNDVENLVERYYEAYEKNEGEEPQDEDTFKAAYDKLYKLHK